MTTTQAAAVLYVEDEDLIRELVVEILEEADLKSWSQRTARRHMMF
jgi:hypothetical protein